MFTRTCALDGCDVQFQTDNPRKQHCSHAHSNLNRVRRYKAKHRKGSGGGGGNGGGGAPETGDLFATIGGAVEYHDSGFVSDKNGYSVNQNAGRKPSRSQPTETTKVLKAVVS